MNDFDKHRLEDLERTNRELVSTNRQLLQELVRALPPLASVEKWVAETALKLRFTLWEKIAPNRLRTILQLVEVVEAEEKAKNG